jgi:hypothetical protein
MGHSTRGFEGVFQAGREGSTKNQSLTPRINNLAGRKAKHKVLLANSKRGSLKNEPLPPRLNNMGALQRPGSQETENQNLEN